MTILPLGNDGIFSLFLYYKSMDVIGNLGEPVASAQRHAVNLSEVTNITVRVKNKFTGFVADVPYRISKEAINLIEVELPAKHQQKGEYSVTVDFDIPTDRLEDKMLHRRVEVSLCNVVETTRPLSTQEYVVMSADVLPLVKGKKGDKGDDAKIPHFTLKKDSSNGKTYMAIGDDYLRDENGERVFLQREVSSTIDYLPVIDLKPTFAQGWNEGAIYAYMESDVPRFRGKFLDMSSVPKITNNFSLSMPSEGLTKDGFYIYGFWKLFDYPQSQPVYGDAVSGRKLFALVVRAKTQGKGIISLSNNKYNVQVNTEDDIFYDVAIPFTPYANQTTFSIITPFAREVGQPSFYIADIRFIEMPVGDPQTFNLLDSTLR